MAENDLKLSVAHVSAIYISAQASFKSRLPFDGLNKREALDFLVTAIKLGTPSEDSHLHKIFLNSESDQPATNEKPALTKKDEKYLHDVLHLLSKNDQHTYMATIMAAKNSSEYENGTSFWSHAKSIVEGSKGTHTEEQIKEAFMKAMPDSLNEFKKGIVESSVSNGVNLDMAKVEKTRTELQSLTELAVIAAKTFASASVRSIKNIFTRE